MCVCVCVCVGGGGGGGWGSLLFGRMLLIIIYKSFPSQSQQNIIMKYASHSVLRVQSTSTVHHYYYPWKFRVFILCEIFMAFEGL